MISQLDSCPAELNRLLNVSQEDADIVIKEIAPYWKGKTFHESLGKALLEETLKLTYDPNDLLKSRFIVNETASFRSSILVTIF